MKDRQHFRCGKLICHPDAKRKDLTQGGPGFTVFLKRLDQFNDSSAELNSRSPRTAAGISLALPGANAIVLWWGEPRRRLVLQPGLSLVTRALHLLFPRLATVCGRRARGGGRLASSGGTTQARAARELSRTCPLRASALLSA